MPNNFFQQDTKSERTEKGKSLIDFPESYTVVDLETTGLSPKYDSILEVSALKVRSGSIVDKFSSLVGTDGYIYIDPFITELTGITQEMIESAPIIDSILPAFLDFIGSDIVVGHNVNFDVNFLYDNAIFYLNRPFPNDFIDTMRISRRLHPDNPHHRLSDLSSHYDISYSNAHRALADCEITYKCFQFMKDEIVNVSGSTDEFIRNVKKANYVRSRDITAENTEFDINNILYNRVCVFTGVLNKMTRKEAMQVVANLGGINGDVVTKKTNYLILGNNDYCSSIKDGKSSKHKKAEKLKALGQDIDIIPENVFYDMISGN